MSAVTYHRRKAAGQCIYCGGPERAPGILMCATCKEAYCKRYTPHLVTWQQVKATLSLLPPKEPEPPQQIGCCGGMQAILRNPLRTACCGKRLLERANIRGELA